MLEIEDLENLEELGLVPPEEKPLVLSPLEQILTEEQRIAMAPTIERSPQSVPVQAVRPAMTGPVSEAARRFRKAAYYFELMHGSLFESTDDIGREVEEELKGIVQERLSHYLGMGGPTQASSAPGVSQFTRDEVVILKSVADSVYKKLQAKSVKKKPRKELEASQPVVSEPPPPVHVESPPPPATPKGAKPTLRARPAPEGTIPAAAAPTPTPQVQATAVASTAGAPPSPGTVLPNGSIYNQDGRTFRVTWVRVNTEDEIPPGVLGMRTATGLFKIINQDITLHERATNGVPMPTSQQTIAISSMKASESLGIQARIVQSKLQGGPR